MCRSIQIVFLILAICCSKTIQSQESRDVPKPDYTNYLQTSSILYGLTKVAENKSLVSELCSEELIRIQQGISQKQTWALKVLDASASKLPGFMFQQNFWLGSRAACAAASEPLVLTLYKVIKRTMKPGLMVDVAPFAVDFRVVYMRHNSPWQVQLTFMSDLILHVGLCMPASCSTREVKRLTEELMQRKMFTEANLYEFHTEVLYVKDLKLKEDFFQRRSFKILLAMLIFTIAMMLYANHSKKSVRETKVKTEGSNGIPPNFKESPQNGEADVNKIRIFAQCFDFNQNWRSLFTIREYKSHEIPVINGLRSLLAMGIVFSHVIWFARFTAKEGALVQNGMEKSVYEIQNLGIYLVEAFFTISGFLHTFLFLRDVNLVERIRKNAFMQNVQIFLVMLMHRYLRLAPLCFVMMCLGDLLSAYLNDVSLFHVYERYDQTCPRNWWHNLLFIQTFFPYSDMCLQWSWTISCEMQYFIWATILIFTYIKHPQLAKRLVVALFAISIGWALYRGVISKYQLASEAVHRTMDPVYIDPLVRVTPFIVGSVTAWYFLTHNRPETINPVLEQVVWNFAMILFFGAAYTMKWRDLNYLASISLYTLGRLMVSVAVCWIIVGSTMGRGYWFSYLMKAKVFQHFNRLTYAIYHLNTVVVLLFGGSRESALDMDLVAIIWTNISAMVIVYFSSVLFSIAFEIPYGNWSNTILKRNKVKTS